MVPPPSEEDFYFNRNPYEVRTSPLLPLPHPRQPDTKIPPQTTEFAALTGKTVRIESKGTVGYTNSPACRRMDEKYPAAAPASLEPAADPTQTNVEVQISSREQVTSAMSGPPPGFGSGPFLEEPPPSAQPPAEAASAPAPTQAEAPEAPEAPAAPTLPAVSLSNTTAPVAAPRQPAVRVPQFVAPSSYLRFKTLHGSTMAAATEQPAQKPAPKPRPSPPSPLDKEQCQGLVRLCVPSIFPCSP